MTQPLFVLVGNNFCFEGLFTCLIFPYQTDKMEIICGQYVPYKAHIWEVTGLHQYMDFINWHAGMSFDQLFLLF